MVDLQLNGLGDRAAEALEASEYLRDLLVLLLGRNPIGKSSAAALARSPLGKRLAVLVTGEAESPF